MAKERELVIQLSNATIPRINVCRVKNKILGKRNNLKIITAEFQGLYYQKQKSIPIL